MHGLKLYTFIISTVWLLNKQLSEIIQFVVTNFERFPCKQASQNYWVFGLCPLSGILETREHVSETWFVSDLSLGGGEGGEIRTLLGPLERANLNHWTNQNVVSFSVLYNTRQWTKFKNPSNTMPLQNWTSCDWG
jgi:hypothetical protein